jgi:hypothetical protein
LINASAVHRLQSYSLVATGDQMAEILVKFDEPIGAPSGETYFAQAVGREMAGGLWEGWMEFIPRGDGADSLESGRETTQPNRTNLEYWAQGLTKVYLEGALARAVRLAAVPAKTRAIGDSTEFGAPTFPGAPPRPRRAPMSPHPILDPFQVYAQGESVLRSELNALSRDHLEAIATAYDLSRGPSASGGKSVSSSAIIDAIVEGVRATT